ncbi:condensation domain-containing protein [Kribbella sp. NPDC056861]|uniref:condensation domain-containing protein n=1 Tax=Kribbella sp. NPDC056861 TaxID=3154857 RepID=UPI0034336119
MTVTPEQLPTLMAELLDLPADELTACDDLIELGLDSLTAMRLAGQWRAAGIDVSFAELIAAPTVKDWQALLAKAGRLKVEGRPADEVDEQASFPLALMQHAYWVGRADNQRLGGVAAHFYNEFDGLALDPARLERAVVRLIERHEMLRVRIGDDGTQRIGPSGWRGLTVHSDHDPEELRQRLSHQAMDIAAGQVFDIQLSVLPDGRSRLHLSLDMIAADALSLRIILGDLARLYAGEELSTLTYSYPRYRAELLPQTVAEDVSYWRNRLASLPSAPRLPVREPSIPRVVRAHRLLSSKQRQRLDWGARSHGLTLAMALAAVFAETLTAWSAEPRFLLNLPFFARQPVDPQIDSVVGDFTSSLLLEWRGDRSGSFRDRARRLQQQFHADAAHSSYSGVEVLRDLSRFAGEQVLAPVVYTSALGLGDLYESRVRAVLGEPAWVVSQGPQVWLDAQVTELDDGLMVNWDLRADVLMPGIPEAMFAHYSALLDRLIADPTIWTEALHLPCRAETSGEVRAPRPMAGPDCVTAPGEGTEALVASVWAEFFEVVVGREHDFFRLGGDSLIATEVLRRLRELGRTEVTLTHIFVHPVLADLAAALDADSGSDASEYVAARIATDPARRHESFGPTEVQRAYFLGRSADFTLGGVGCHFYREYNVPEIDTGRLAEAADLLVGRHEMLRAVFDANGDQRVLPEVPGFAVEEFGSFAGLRDALAETTFEPTAWPLFRIGVGRDGSRVRIGIGMDNLVADALSVMICHRELAALYEDPAVELPTTGLAFRDYVLALPSEPSAAATAYWDRQLETLPPAPELPLATNPASVAAPRFRRRSMLVPGNRWQLLASAAQRYGVTQSGMLLTAYAEVLSRFSCRPDLTVNVTLFDRRDVHPEVNRTVGDFTSLVLVGFRPDTGESFLGRARRLQAELAGALDHREVSTLGLLRDLSRRSGRADGGMPVVFTSALGLSALETGPGADSEMLANPGWGLSQTPQVWLDHQVIERSGPDGIAVELVWDAVDELFPDGLLDTMFAAYQRLLEHLSVTEWDAELPPAPARPTKPAASARPVLPVREVSSVTHAAEAAVIELWTELLDTPPVGADGNFFALGGDSVAAIRFIETAARELGAGISLAGFFAGPTVRQVAELIAEAWSLEEGEI